MITGRSDRASASHLFGGLCLRRPIKRAGWQRSLASLIKRPVVRKQGDDGLYPLVLSCRHSVAIARYFLRGRCALSPERADGEAAILLCQLSA